MDTNEREHRITVKIANLEPFKIPVAQSEESFYRQVIARINDNVNRLCYSPTPESVEVALAKVALYYATMLYHRTNVINSQASLLDEFEKKLDALIADM